MIGIFKIYLYFFLYFTLIFCIFAINCNNMFFKIVNVIVIFTFLIIIIYFRNKRYDRKRLYEMAVFGTMFSIKTDNSGFKIIVFRKNENGIEYYYLDDNDKVLVCKPYSMSKDEFLLSDLKIEYVGHKPSLLLEDFES